MSIALLAAARLVVHISSASLPTPVSIDSSEPASTINVVEAPASPDFDVTLACYTSVTVRSGHRDRAVDSVFQLAKSHDAKLAAMGVDALARIGTPYAQGVLAVVLCGADDPFVRAHAADRLGDLPDGESTFLLAMAADHEQNPEVREVVIANLEKAFASLPKPLPDRPETRAIVRAIARPRSRAGHRTL